MVLAAGIVASSGCRWSALSAAGRWPARGLRQAAPATAPPAWPPHLVLDRALDAGAAAALRAELVVLGAHLERLLGTPPGERPLTFTVFAAEATYRSYVAQRYPDFPYRRAVFVDGGGRMEAAGYWGPHIREDLRHESTHAYLHASMPGLPLWLDEGLAEYFETDPAPGAEQAAHRDVLAEARRSEGRRPDLERLERLTDASTMSAADYAESWLWAHYLLRDPHRAAALASYLKDLREGRGAEPISVRLARVAPSAAAELAAEVEGAGRRALAP